MPLLPEYLSQPVQIMVQSSTDWGAVWVGASASLLGAALGAGLGGYVAYRGTIKANNSLLRRQKLEEAFSLLSSLNNSVSAVRKFTSCVDDEYVINSEDDNAFNALMSVDFDEVRRLRALMNIYGGKLLSGFSQLDDFFFGLELVVWSVGCRKGKHTAMPNCIPYYRSMSTELKNALIKELRL